MSVCKSKTSGGLGVKPVAVWNQVVLVKHVWDLQQEKQSLWAKWVIIYKLKRLSFWGIIKTIDYSWSWRQLLNLRPAIKNLFEYRHGDGRRFSFWYDPWCAGQAIVERFHYVCVADSGVNKRAIVKDLWKNGRWVFPIPLDCNIQSVRDYVARNFVLGENCSDISSEKLGRMATLVLLMPGDPRCKKGIKLAGLRWHGLGVTFPSTPSSFGLHCLIGYRQETDYANGMLLLLTHAFSATMREKR